MIIYSAFPYLFYEVALIVKHKLHSQIHQYPVFKIELLIIGDMNLCNKQVPNNALRSYLEGENFQLVIKEATYIEGSHIDHAYILNVGNFEELPEIDLIPKYYSDHDAICITWKISTTAKWP